ncbi:uncharacterized protein LOC117179714 [Belonocnema kinseyi]|uniref:uncharacterized protein LOC117179714 n=1 Tax=Belonocnema kinseyi TaxID=2817044 RepID=UPI00143DF4B2|nr:uncharacterized protein LOC117179714 [Belonocnema kinseyi]XP_033227648.1 uncharacterized protein LOC117179714 [Belonocnema kinseyi]
MYRFFKKMKALENSDITIKEIPTWTEIINLVIWVFVLLSTLGLLQAGLMDTNFKEEYQNIPLCKKIIPFENLKYSGINDMMHPKSFIENFEYLVTQENLDEHEKQYFFIQSLTNDAKSWLNLHGYGTYEEMKKAFLKFYWSPDIQKTFWKFLLYGEYHFSAGLSEKDYIFKYFNEAKFLDNPPTEKKAILYLLSHFNLDLNLRTSIINEFNSGRVKTIEEALDYLTRAEVFKNRENNEAKKALEKNVIFFLLGVCFSLIVADNIR